MITNNDKFKVINTLKSHTKSTVRENQKKLLPVFNTGRIYNTDKFYLNDKVYSYKYSDDNPESNYSIIYVENIPYKSFITTAYGSTRSFCSRMDKMVYNNHVQPFLLFINNIFIKWNDIEIIKDSDDNYLKIYDKRFNYFNIKEIQMIVLPFSVNYISSLDDEKFDEYLLKTVEYINSSSYVNNKDQLTIKIPRISTVYNNYDIGYWYYNQLRLIKMGLIKDKYIEKLKSVDIVKFIYNNSGVAIKAYSTVLNLLDKDSYILSDYESICADITDNVLLFGFNNNGLLVTDTNKIDIGIYIKDKNYIINTFENDGLSLSFMQSDIKTELYPENYFLFKNGLLCNIYDIDIKALNYCKISNVINKEYNNDGNEKEVTNSKLSCISIYNKSIENVVSNIYNFKNTEYLSNEVNEHYFGDEVYEYINQSQDSLDFSYNNEYARDDNMNNAFNNVLNYNPLLLDNLTKRNVYSTCISGKDINKYIVEDQGKYIFKVPRMAYEDHESFVLIFVNGNLLDEYSNIKNLANYFKILIDKKFNDTDIVELLFFTYANNNELEFVFNGTNYNSYPSIINDNELKLFCSNPPKELYKYPDTEYKEYLSFPVYDYDEEGNLSTIDDDLLTGCNLTAVSSKKFVYQRIKVDNKSYKIHISDDFKYCDNQKQYVLFINGKRMINYYYFITSSKLTRPFDDLYLYTARFVDPTDRIELFYLPIELIDMNIITNPINTTLQMPLISSSEFYIDKDGYLTCNKNKLDYLYSKENYLFFINGKKIPQCDLMNINSNNIRILKDTKSLNCLIVSCIAEETPNEITEYCHSNKISTWDKIIDTILSDDNLYKTELDKLNGTYIKLSNTEENAMYINTGRIAIINEIVRDFWVTSGYDYQASPFLYDYNSDEFKTYDEEGNLIIPSLDAVPNININKYDLHHLYFSYADTMPGYYEIGSGVLNPTFKWEYDNNYGVNNTIISQTFNGIEIDPEDREYTVSDYITSDRDFYIEANDGYSICRSERSIKFCNSIFYGALDEDLIDGKESDIYSNNPSELLLSGTLTQYINPSPKMCISNYKIGNNAYFMFALPKRLAYDENEKPLITFYCPDINSDIYKNAIDDKTKPILTNGSLDESDDYIHLHKYEMELFKEEFEFTNASGYTETYVIFKSNGFFTRLYGDISVTFNIK